MCLAMHLLMLGGNALVSIYVKVELLVLKNFSFWDKKFV